jgi:acyl carrier protein phosphodiesterase
MNYLAHAYLSFHQPEILAGNMISDFIKGKKQYDYPLAVQKGIQLHRAIDSFTDMHPVTKEAKQYLKPAAGSYAGAFIDVVYDHFLALDETEFSSPSLQAFANEVYQQLNSQQSLLPEKFIRILPFMSRQNWLYNYRFMQGIENSFHGVARRAVYFSDAAPVFALFQTHYLALEKLYADFFPDVKKFARQRLDELLNA